VSRLPIASILKGWSLVATFADDALVNDQLRDYWGKPATREWAGRNIIGASPTMDVTNVIEHYGNFIVYRKCQRHV
jgi:hypothetical protein